MTSRSFPSQSLSSSTTSAFTTSPVHTPSKTSTSRLSLLETFDFGKTLEEFDPSTGIITGSFMTLSADGHRVIYDREVPVQISVSKEELATPELTRVKILLLGEENSPESTRIEISTETDLFFHYTHTITRSTFKTVRQEQKLKVEFNEYPAVLIRMFNNCIREPNTYVFPNSDTNRFLAVITLHEGGLAKFDFVQNMVYKQLELLSIDCVCSAEEIVRQQIHFRYNALKSRVETMQNQLNELVQLLKVKNPSLLKLLQKQNTGLIK